MEGRTISHYNIQEQIGQGGMGTVYKAEDTLLERPVALKFLTPELARTDTAQERFLREARAVAALNHRNIITIHEIAEAEDRFFICMEYVGGGTLRDQISERPLDLADALLMAISIADGLHYAHRRNVIHRDIKPGNILLTEDQEVKISDFGLARLLDAQTLTNSSELLGTISYMSPEQIQGQPADQRSDLFAYGVLLYEMLTGRRPFVADSEVAVIYGILQEDPPLLRDVRPELPEMFETIVMKSLDKEPEARYQGMDEVLEALRDMTAGQVDPVTRQPEAQEPDTINVGSPDVEADISSQTQIPTREITQEADETEEVDRPADETASLMSDVETVSIPGVSDQTTFLHLDSRKRTGFGILLLIIVLVGAYLWRTGGWQDSITMSSRDQTRMVVMPFDNRTGDPELDWLRHGLLDMLYTDLSQSQQLYLVSQPRLRDILKRSTQTPLASIDLETGFEVSEMAEAQMLVTGSYTRAGATWRVDALVYDVATKEILNSVKHTGDGVESILTDVVDVIAAGIRSELGDTEVAADTDRLLVDMTTTSLEAYKYYISGLLDQEQQHNPAALANLRKAVALDSTFAMAYHRLSIVANQLGSFSASHEYATRALQYAGKATERERLHITARHAQEFERNVGKALTAYQTLIRKYPDEIEARYQLGMIFYYERQYQEAVEVFQQLIEKDPLYDLAYNRLGYTYSALGEHERAVASIRSYIDLKPGESNPYDSLGDVYRAMGAFDQALPAYQEALRLNPNFIYSPVKIGEVYDRLGRHEQARASYRTLLEGNPEAAGTSLAHWHTAVSYLFEGRYSAALDYLQERARFYKESDDQRGAMVTQHQIGRIYLELGQTEAAEQVFGEIENTLNTLSAADPSAYVIDISGLHRNMGLLNLASMDPDAAQNRLHELETLIAKLGEKASIYVTEPVYTLTGHIAMTEGAYDDAVTAFQKVRSLIGDNGMTLHYLADAILFRYR